jgi:hypothetical protein
MPPAAVTGRPRSFCSAQCRQANERLVVSQHREEKERREREEAAGVREKAEADRARREEWEYQRAIAAGGDTAAEARWQRLYAETLDATASRLGLCQWDLASGRPGACTNRTANVYCAKHNRQVDREAARRKERADRVPMTEGGT